MTRTAARELAVHLCYELSFSDLTADALLAERLTPEAFAFWQEEDALYAAAPEATQKSYIEALVRGVASHEPELDAYIARYAVGWDFGRIPRVAVAVMKVCMYEILYMPDIPSSAAINEAVEISKKYEDARVVSFLNGILGSFSRKEVPGAPVAKPPAPEEAAPGEAAPEEAPT